MIDPMPVIVRDVPQEQRAGHQFYAMRTWLKDDEGKRRKRWAGLLMYSYTLDGETWWKVAFVDRELETTFQTHVKESELIMPKVQPY